MSHSLATRATFATLATRNRRRITCGFTLLEVMIVVSIAGTLGSIMLPQAKKAANTARASAVANDLRLLASTMSAIAQQAGRYPKDTGRRKMPPAAAGHAKGDVWINPTPIGGYYNWESGRNIRGMKIKAGIAINSQKRQKVTRDRALLLAVDRLIDDGNLNGGNFRLGTGNEPVYIIEY
ncbi:MAG: prepilin-type N-terminal cleavage/methylation domain-containing protein [Opitutaceae bacterium]|nr:prepilin-type N-terminal cleavage/methylation domain-containing protein [Opitutaceae bacterium]